MRGGGLALLAAYVGYVWWTGATHGDGMALAAFFAAPGVLLGGSASLAILALGLWGVLAPYI
ncbi:hypothetical protein [Streptomyces exfoliatus]|uniref:hypothetical protein n=1 Tax=Streptomyces exfoliatus TaxID=1905 RepID=UPI0012FE9914|nr:hypothetical protein [Streptomyces exfoliatus]